MADWEDDDWEADGPINLPGGGDGGDKESWSDEEGHDAHLVAEEVPPPVQPAKPNTPKPKTKLELKIEEREAREREEAERKKEILAAAEAKEKAARSAAGADLSPELADKIRRQALEEASDFDAARDAFGEGQTPKARPAPAAAPGDTIEAADPKTDKDFERLASKINEKLAKYEGKKGHMVCLKALIRSCTANMSSDDCKDLSSTLAVISNDKLKADRDKDKSKVKKNKAKAKFNEQADRVRSDHDAMIDGFGDGGVSGWSGGGGGRDDDYDFM